MGFTSLRFKETDHILKRFMVYEAIFVIDLGKSEIWNALLTSGPIHVPYYPPHDWHC